MGSSHMGIWALIRIIRLQGLAVGRHQVRVPVIAFGPGFSHGRDAHGRVAALVARARAGQITGSPSLPAVKSGKTHWFLARAV